MMDILRWIRKCCEEADEEPHSDIDDLKLQQVLDKLSKQKFEIFTPDVFFQCESGVFAKGDVNSMCYTTSSERSEILVAILNDWARLRKAESKLENKR